jgi:hypothetical protein
MVEVEFFELIIKDMFRDIKIQFRNNIGYYFVLIFSIGLYMLFQVLEVTFYHVGRPTSVTISPNFA